MKTSNMISTVVAAILLSSTTLSAATLADYADNTYVQEVAAQLAIQGYEITEISTTMLGRIKIEAVNNGSKREIILNANTGAVLRDEWSNSDGSMSGADDFDDDSDDDHGDDVGDDDHGDDDGDDDHEDDDHNEGEDD